MRDIGVSASGVEVATDCGDDVGDEDGAAAAGSSVSERGSGKQALDAAPAPRKRKRGKSKVEHGGAAKDMSLIALFHQIYFEAFANALTSSADSECV